MANTVVGLMDRAEAQEAVDELLECGFERSDIAFLACELHGDAAPDDASAGHDAASGAMKGAGAALSGIAGLVTGLSSLTIPGLGPVIASGSIATTLAGAAGGGLVGALTRMGVPEEEAHYYSEGVRRGGTLVTVNTTDDRLANAAADLMREFGAVDIKQRAEEWRQAGWSGSFQTEEQPAVQSPQSHLTEQAAQVRPRPYTGPERRRGTLPWTGVNRRLALG